MTDCHASIARLPGTVVPKCRLPTALCEVLMASLLPAMRGKFGSTEYFVVTMPAKELTERLVLPRDVEGWGELSIEEKYQREVSYRRVKQQIAPYLATDEDRFFGAFIVSVSTEEEIEFEPVTSILKATIPALYRDASDAFGFLTLKGSELLVPLDGQHRLAALRFAISGKDEKQQPIEGLGEYSPSDIAADACTVILVRDDRAKSRKIFNKVNRYAKKTTASENLITADDDIIAVIVRENIVGGENAIPLRLVNTSSNTLNVSASEFTTLSTLYNGTRAYLRDLAGHNIDTQGLPDKPHQALWRKQAEEFWMGVCEGITHFRNALSDPTEGGDEKRQELRKDFVIGKPVAQWAVIEAIVRLCAENAETGERLSTKEACRRINELDWSMEEASWQQVLLNGSRVLSGRTVVNVAARVIAYRLGEPLGEDALADLTETYKERTGKDLPEPIPLD